MNYIYQIKGVDKTSEELNYEDIVFLCKEYIKKHNSFPSDKDFKYCNNLPSFGKLKRTLQKEGMSKHAFMKQYGWERHYTLKGSEANYFEYVNEYKRLSKELKRPIGEKELKKYSLPRGDWFVKHCPDPNIDSWNAFISWCGFLPMKKRTKEAISELLLNYDQTHDKPITKRDLTVEKMGISISQINNIWGNLGNCKKELGLKLSPIGPTPKPFEYYKNNLDSIIDKIIDDGKTEIVWADILKNGYIPCDYESLKKAFKREGINLFDYISNKGLTFWRASPEKSASYVFITGESVRSSYEYDFSLYLMSMGFIFERDYQRDVLYKELISQNIQKKINCDYLFYNTFCVEILGLLTNQQQSNREKSYAAKARYKESLLKDNNIPYLFLYPQDFVDDSYKSKFLMFLIDNLHKYKFLKVGE